jgi:hypothetical protein
MKRTSSAALSGLFCTILVVMLASAAPRSAFAADDGTVRSLLAACDAGDNACLIDILSPLQAMIFVSNACPTPDMHEDEALNTLVPWLQNAVAKNPAVADRKADDVLKGAIGELYPCPPPAN